MEFSYVCKRYPRLKVGTKQFSDGIFTPASRAESESIEGSDFFRAGLITKVPRSEARRHEITPFVAANNAMASTSSARPFTYTSPVPESRQVPPPPDGVEGPTVPRWETAPRPDGFAEMQVRDEPEPVPMGLAETMSVDSSSLGSAKKATLLALATSRKLEADPNMTRKQLIAAILASQAKE